jgi:hypothetical protein
MLHYYLCNNNAFIFMGFLVCGLYLSLYLWVFLVYDACICLLLFPYDSLHLENVFVCYKLYIYSSASVSVCICFNLHTLRKISRYNMTCEVRLRKGRGNISLTM